MDGERRSEGWVGCGGLWLGVVGVVVEEGAEDGRLGDYETAKGDGWGWERFVEKEDVA